MPAPKRAVRITAVAASAQLGGTERVLLDFAARAFEHDINLRVLTPREGPLIGILNEIGVPAAAVPASERMLAGSQRAGHVWTLPGSVAGLVAWARRLERHEFFQDADAIYTVAFKAHLAVAWLRRHPVVWHLHEYPPTATSILWRLTSRFVPDAMIANSEATAYAWGKGERGRGKGKTASVPFPLPRSPFPVILNGVDLDRFHPRPRTFWIHEKLGIPREHRIVGMPAVFARWKGQIEVIKAFSVLSSQFPDAHLVIVGGSIYDTVAEREYGEELRAAVQGKGEGIHILPFQPKIELVYPEFDLALHYSLRPEPFGRVILEAMATGVPVVAAGEGGPVEILGKRETGNEEDVQRASYNVHRTSGGWLAPPRDVAGLAAVLREALSLPPDRLRSLGEAARRRAEDHFSARQFARKVADVLRGAVLKTAVGLTALLAGLGVPATLGAQADSASLHATLRGWEEDTWLQLLDRGGAIGGRLSRNGMLQRFQPLIDDEYYIDLISGPFGLSENYAWYRQPNGARYWGASVDHLELVTAFDVKAQVRLGDAWTTTVRFNKAHSHELRRDLVRLEFQRSWTSGMFWGLHGTLDAIKPDIDLETRAGYRRADGREIGGAVGVLDVFSDIIYQVLVVWEGYADTALDYERQPLTLRTWAEWPLGRRLRLEAHGGLMTPTTVRAYRQVAPDSGFRQHERYEFAAGLLEWTATSRLQAGGFATYVRARTDRTPLPLSPADDDFLLTETTSRYGGYALAQLAERWRLEGWLARTARPERRDQRQLDSLDVDFEDRWLSGEARLTYGRRSGFRGDASLEFVNREVARGFGQVAAPASRNNSRLRLEVGWQFGDRAMFRAGYRVDVDGDPGQGKGAFDGAEGRFVISW